MRSCDVDATSDCVAVINPRRLRTSRLPAQRIPLGIPGDYKPCVAKLPDGELILTAFNQQARPGRRWQEDTVVFRSTDGGISWSPRSVVPELLGREAYITVLKDGTILVTTHMNYHEVRNEEGYMYSYLHRSSDGGRTWQSLKIGYGDVPGTIPNTFPHNFTLVSRNLLELADGSLMMGVSSWTGISYLWRSYDSGRSWDKTLACVFEGTGGDELPKHYGDGGDGGFPRMDEAVFWQAPCGDLLGIFRVHQLLFPLPGTEIAPVENDQSTRMLVFRSTDGGRNWKVDKELGSYYGEMYPAVLRLADGRLLFTFTVRAERPPLGVHAVLGRELHDRFEFDFRNDRFVLDDKTPVGKPSGGGFGRTVQLEDGTLVTSYSYRGEDNLTHLEVVRWNLPSE